MKDLLGDVLNGITRERKEWKPGTEEELKEGLQEFLQQKDAKCPFVVGDIVLCVDKNSKIKKAVVVDVCETFVAHLRPNTPLECVNMYIGTMVDDDLFKVFSGHSSDFVKAPVGGQEDER